MRKKLLHSISYILSYKYVFNDRNIIPEKIIKLCIILPGGIEWGHTQFRIKQWMRELLIYRRSLC